MFVHKLCAKACSCHPFSKRMSAFQGLWVIATVEWKLVEVPEQLNPLLSAWCTCREGSGPAAVCHCGEPSRNKQPFEPCSTACEQLQMELGLRAPTGEALPLSIQGVLERGSSHASLHFTRFA